MDKKLTREDVGELMRLMCGVKNFKIKLIEKGMHPIDADGLIRNFLRCYLRLNLWK